MPKYIKAPQNTYFQPKKSKKMAGNKKWSEEKNRFCSNMGLGGGESLFQILSKSLIVKK